MCMAQVIGYMNLRVGFWIIANKSTWNESSSGILNYCKKESKTWHGNKGRIEFSNGALLRYKEFIRVYGRENETFGLKSNPN